MSKFKSVPVEADTEILGQKEIELDGFNVLHQQWKWEAIKAESIIFANDDIVDIPDNQLEDMVMASPIVNDDSSITLKRSDSGFTFVNFNFVY